MLVQRGGQGPAVLLLQKRLRELGYDVPAEPACGQATAAALRQFQKARGLKPDGVAGPRTWGRLFPPVRFTREYLDGVLYAGGPIYDDLDKVVAAVAAGESGAFDALQLNCDGEGLSFGLLQWAQNPGSLHLLLKAWSEANPEKFTAILGDGDPNPARILLQKTRGRGKNLALWQSPWPWRFWLAGRDLEFQQVQRRLARRQVAGLLEAGYAAYPARFKPGGRIALRALVMLADVGNQAGPRGMRRALRFAAAREPADEGRFIAALGDYVEGVIHRKYGSANYGNTAGRHDAVCRTFGMEKVDWPALMAGLGREKI